MGSRAASSSATAAAAEVGAAILQGARWQLRYGDGDCGVFPQEFVCERSTIGKKVGSLVVVGRLEAKQTKCQQLGLLFFALCGLQEGLFKKRFTESAGRYATSRKWK